MSLPKIFSNHISLNIKCRKKDQNGETGNKVVKKIPQEGRSPKDGNRDAAGELAVFGFYGSLLKLGITI